MVIISPTYLTDFGLTQPADSPRSTKVGTYGVVPYMAPELFRGEPHSKATDIYAFGIIMSEYASNEPAFCNRSHDMHLQLKIINGLRPEVPPETPKCYKKLMNKCLSKDPLKRPTATELNFLLVMWSQGSEVNQFSRADEKRKQKKSKPIHTDTVYTSRYITYVSLETGTYELGYKRLKFTSPDIILFQKY